MTRRPVPALRLPARRARRPSSCAPAARARADRIPPDGSSPDRRGGRSTVCRRSMRCGEWSTGSLRPPPRIDDQRAARRRAHARRRASRRAPRQRAPRRLLEQRCEQRAASQVVVMADSIRHLDGAGQQHDRARLAVGRRARASPRHALAAPSVARMHRCEPSAPRSHQLAAAQPLENAQRRARRDRASPPAAGRTSDRGCAGRRPRHAAPGR